MVEGGMSCIKYILFVFNFIFVIFAGLLIYFGFTVIQEAQEFKGLVDTPDTMAIGVIVVGFFIFIVAFLGCCGAILESYCILLSFGIVVAIILTLELALAGVAFAFKSDLRSATVHGLTNTMERYNWTDSENKYTKLVDDFQWNLKCCGFNSSDDWHKMFPDHKTDLPRSCCPKSANNTGNETNTCTLPPSDGSNSTASVFDEKTVPFDHGCVDTVVDALQSSVGPVGLACIAVAMVQLLGILFAFCMGRAVKREYQVV